MNFYKLPLQILCLLVLCTSIGNKYNLCTPEEEQHLAHEFLTQANKTSINENKERMRLFEKATFHFANIVVRNDANDTLRADALFTLRWIAAYITHDYDLALQYLNQYLELVGPEHEVTPHALHIRPMTCGILAHTILLCIMLAWLWRRHTLPMTK
jgi:hypothetical protein